MNPAHVHPIFGGLVLLVLAYSGYQGLQLRGRPRQRGVLAKRHSRWAPWAYAGVLVSWAGGLASTLWLRGDLGVAATLHFRIGTALVLLLSGSLLSARLLRRGRSGAREIHPWLGAAALLLAAAQIATGLRVMP